MEFRTDILDAQRMNTNDFGGPLTFVALSAIGQSLGHDQIPVL